jgi:hypothetical protein
MVSLRHFFRIQHNFRSAVTLLLVNLHLSTGRRTSMLLSDSQIVCFVSSLLSFLFHLVSCRCTLFTKPVTPLSPSTTKLTAQTKEAMRNREKIRSRFVCFLRCLCTRLDDRVPCVYSQSSSEPFNERFQKALALPEQTNSEQLRKWERLVQLSTDFTAVAKLYSRTIVAELHAEQGARTLREAAVGGLAGGRKFIVGDVVMIKLCLDVPVAGGRFLYGSTQRRDDFAMKAAGHELKSAIAFFQMHSLGVRVPLSALVDCCGIRLLCMPLLPISKNTLIYG